MPWFVKLSRWIRHNPLRVRLIKGMLSLIAALLAGLMVRTTHGEQAATLAILAGALAWVTCEVVVGVLEECSDAWLEDSF